ncbi:MAG TPA: flagellar basal body P-ring formation chaperone FlgA [Burkholderiaceae bacterium]|nr:flagellar basal body P-ring formation chaperone FlgA [Burkholderiaceae bacterium]
MDAWLIRFTQLSRGALAIGVLALTLAVADRAQAQTAVADAAADLNSLAETFARPGLDEQARKLGLRLELEVGRIDPRLRLAPCARAQAYLPVGVRLWGRARIGVRCVEGTARWNISVPVAVRLYGPALVTVRDIESGARLTPADVRFAEVEYTAEHEAPLRDMQDVVDRVARHRLAAQQALRPNALRTPITVAAGDTVQIVQTGDGFSVGTEGTALASVSEGQPVRVRTNAGRVLDAVAGAGKTVVVAR